MNINVQCIDITPHSWITPASEHLMDQDEAPSNRVQLVHELVMTHGDFISFASQCRVQPRHRMELVQMPWHWGESTTVQTNWVQIQTKTMS